MDNRTSDDEFRERLRIGVEAGNLGKANLDLFDHIRAHVEGYAEGTGFSAQFVWNNAVGRGGPPIAMNTNEALKFLKDHEAFYATAIEGLSKLRAAYDVQAFGKPLFGPPLDDMIRAALIAREEAYGRTPSADLRHAPMLDPFGYIPAALPSPNSPMNGFLDVTLKKLKQDRAVFRHAIKAAATKGRAYDKALRDWVCFRADIWKGFTGAPARRSTPSDPEGHTYKNTGPFARFCRLLVLTYDGGEDFLKINPLDREIEHVTRKRRHGKSPA